MTAAWCPNCKEPRTVPFQPSAEDMRCDACGFRLTKPSKAGRKRSLKSTGPKRDWTAAIAKRDGEECCRLGRDGTCSGRLEAAHVTGREHDPPWSPPDDFDPDTDEVFELWVRPESVVPLCSSHHRRYDLGAVDVLPVLTLDEQLRAFLDLDGIEAARLRTAPTAYSEGALSVGGGT